MYELMLYSNKNGTRTFPDTGDNELELSTTGNRR
jgi:hypothetical protein